MATTQQLTVTANFEGGATEDVTTQATYQSSATGVAMVSTGGLITAVGPGDATVTATFSGASDTCAVHVDAVLQSITTTPDPVVTTVGVGEPTDTMAHYDVGPDVDVTSSATYESADIGVATVGADGVVTGVAAGTTTVTITYQGKTDTVTVNVT